MAAVKHNIFFCDIRRYGFYLLDILGGGKIAKHYRDNRSILENSNDAYTKKLQKRYLDDLLNHAVQTTGYYLSYRNKDILDFPVIDKNIIRENPMAFRSSDSRYKQYTEVVTSGSTGTPFSISHDRRKRERNSADTIYFSELAGFRIGYKLYYFKIWNKINSKSRLRSFIENIVPYDVRSLNDSSIGLIHDLLAHDNGPKGLLAYSSFYDVLAFYLKSIDARPVSNNTKSIIAMSESLSAETRKAISYYYKANAVSRYSNVENGILAQQLPDGSDEFVINEAGFYVEVLSTDSDKPVPYGTSGRIVVTDYFNYCMPMIRYDTGDIGVLDYKVTASGRRLVFKSVDGRRMDMIYDTSGSHISSFIITNNMWKYKEVKQYQFIQQSSNEYLFRLNAAHTFSRENELKEEFRGYLGKDSVIRTEYVDEIPLLDSGKRKKVINSWLKTKHDGKISDLY
jgi:phenylacetate-CoA ligase